MIEIELAPSDDRTRQTALSFPGIRYALELNFARNGAVRETSGEWLAFIDDDVPRTSSVMVALARPDFSLLSRLYRPIQWLRS